MAAKKKKKATITKETPIHKATIQARHDFTDAEKLEIAGKLSYEHNRVNELTAQMKSVVGDYKSKIKTAEGRVDELANKMNSGYEMRPTEVKVEFDAKGGMKSYFRLDSGEFITKEPMDHADYQLALPMDKKEDKPFNPVIKEDLEPAGKVEDEEEPEEAPL